MATDVKKNDPLSFIPGIIKNQVTSLLIKELKKQNIKTMILFFDPAKEGTDAFDGVFLPNNISQQLANLNAIMERNKHLELVNKQLEHKVKLFQEQKKLNRG